MSSRCIQALAAELGEGAFTGVLSPDSSNVVTLVEDLYNVRIHQRRMKCPILYYNKYKEYNNWVKDDSFKHMRQDLSHNSLDQ